MNLILFLFLIPFTVAFKAGNYSRAEFVGTCPDSSLTCNYNCTKALNLTVNSQRIFLANPPSVAGCICPVLEGSTTDLNVTQSFSGYDYYMASISYQNATGLLVTLRNGPQAEFVYPKLPNGSEGRMPNGVELPEEWSFLSFTCLPDGAHASEEEFIYFHLPPVPSWSAPYDKTIFGLACFRQIPTDKLLNKTADMTRTTVQKSIVVLSTDPILGSIKSKLALVTQAFFEQKDFSQLEILHSFYESLQSSFSGNGIYSDAILFQGASPRLVVSKLKHKTLQILKLMLLGKRILFFGQKVERLTSFQYALVSLVPEVLSNLSDVGSPLLEFNDNREAIKETRDLSKAVKSNMPLEIFGKGAVWLPYIPLQQINILLSPETRAFVVGTSNQMFTQHKGCQLDLIVYTDNGNIEVVNPEVNQLIALSSADKKFMDEIIESVSDEESQELEYNGSDEDIRNRFERYLYSLLIATKMSSDISIITNGQPKPLSQAQIFADYTTNWVKSFLNSPSYLKWSEKTNDSLEIPTILSLDTADSGSLETLAAGHPYQGTTVFSSLVGSLGKNMAPLQSNVQKALYGAESSLSNAVTSIKDPQNQQKLQAGASKMLSGVSSWYNQKKTQIGAMMSSQSKINSAAASKEQLHDDKIQPNTTEPPRISSDEEYVHVHNQ